MVELSRPFACTMELITILNRCHRFRGFIYYDARVSSDHKSIEIAVRPRKGSKAICSRCLDGYAARFSGAHLIESLIHLRHDMETIEDIESLGALLADDLQISFVGGICGSVFCCARAYMRLIRRLKATRGCGPCNLRIHFRFRVSTDWV